MASPIEPKHIRNHFIMYPDWKELYTRFYTIESTTPENYIERAETLFKRNGYTFKFKKGRLSGSAAVYHNGEELYSFRTSDWNWLQSIVVDFICGNDDLSEDERIDYSKFI